MFSSKGEEVSSSGAIAQEQRMENDLIFLILFSLMHPFFKPFLKLVSYMFF